MNAFRLKLLMKLVCAWLPGHCYVVARKYGRWIIHVHGTNTEFYF